MISLGKFAKFVESLKVEAKEGEKVKLPQLSVMSNGDKENFYDVTTKEEEEPELDPPLEFPSSASDTLNNSMFKPPSGFSVGPVEKQKKGDKTTFYCELCLVELNSHETMRSHVRGAKHMRKKMALSEESENDVLMGRTTEEEAERLRPKVVVIPNLERTKKVPTRLHEKVREAMDPVVGLAYIMEILPSSDQEVEPHYQCELCGAQGQANGMLSHVLGTKHRENFMDIKRGITRVNLSRDALLREVRPYRENNRRLSDLIKTKISDEEYSWPPGKAPWAAERGGNGVPPVGRGGSCTTEKKPVVNGGTKLPPPDSILPPSSVDEAIRMLEVGKRITKLAMEFSGSGVSEKDANVMTVIMDSILNRALDNLADGGREAPSRPLGGK